jgi:two-component system, NarL family, nitrate/nitrite response regulator NarL
MTLLERDSWRTGDGDSSTRIALVEDHRLLSAALSVALVAEGYDVVVAAITTLDAVLADVVGLDPHIVLLDLDLGDAGSGEDLVAAFTRAGSAVLVVSGTSDRARIGRCLEHGAVGWMPKGSSLDELLSAVLAASTGQSVLGLQDRECLLEAAREQRQSATLIRSKFEPLTRRESEVLAMLMDGRSVERIAEASYVSENTVRSQVRGVLQKLGVKSQLEAVALASRSRWTPSTV